MGEPAVAEPQPPEGGVCGRREQFERDGFLHLRGFASSDECAALQQRMQEIIGRWDPEETMSPVFTTAGDQVASQGSSDYFLDSADRVHFFLEKDALAEDGRLRPSLAKARALNKVGHGLHAVDDVFREYCHSAKVTRLVAELGWRDPVVPQSMYIFKQPAIGGEVTSHQDSTFLYTTPRPTCLGLWLALDPATLENGCLWARPGSHKEAVRRLFVRNPAHFTDADKSAPQMIFDQVAGEQEACKAWQWDGKLPKGCELPDCAGLRGSGFRPLECEVGDLVVIHGQVDHLSLANTSSRPRETFQLHLIEGPGEGIAWSDRNWLQYPAGKPFPSLGAPAGQKRKAEAL